MHRMSGLETIPRHQENWHPRILPETIWRWDINEDKLGDLAEEYSPINLDEMEMVSLLNRKDTKFLMSTHQLLNSMRSLQDDYRILSINGKRLNHYRSLYFDTPDFRLYNMHVNGRADRYKVRSREYTDSQLSFLEVKHKTNKDRTIKDRLATTRLVVQLDM